MSCYLLQLPHGGRGEREFIACAHSQIHAQSESQIQKFVAKHNFIPISPQKHRGPQGSVFEKNATVAPLVTILKCSVLTRKEFHRPRREWGPRGSLPAKLGGRGRELGEGGGPGLTYRIFFPYVLEVKTFAYVLVIDIPRETFNLLRKHFV